MNECVCVCVCVIDSVWGHYYLPFKKILSYSDHLLIFQEASFSLENKNHMQCSLVWLIWLELRLWI